MERKQVNTTCTSALKLAHRPTPANPRFEQKLENELVECSFTPVLTKESLLQRSPSRELPTQDSILSFGSQDTYESEEEERGEVHERVSHPSLQLTLDAPSGCLKFILFLVPGSPTSGATMHSGRQWGKKGGMGHRGHLAGVQDARGPHVLPQPSNRHDPVGEADTQGLGEFTKAATVRARDVHGASRDSQVELV
jgi:hypothetical protein